MSGVEDADFNPEQVDSSELGPSEMDVGGGSDTTVPDGDDVDWARVWDEFNFSPDSYVSKTQLAAAIRASDETGAATEDAVDELAGEALDAGVLSQIKKRTPSEDALALAGYRLEVDRDEF